MKSLNGHVNLQIRYIHTSLKIKHVISGTDRSCYCVQNTIFVMAYLATPFQRISFDILKSFISRKKLRKSRSYFLANCLGRLLSRVWGNQNGTRKLGVAQRRHAKLATLENIFLLVEKPRMRKKWWKDRYRQLREKWNSDMIRCGALRLRQCVPVFTGHINARACERVNMRNVDTCVYLS